MDVHVPKGDILVVDDQMVPWPPLVRENAIRDKPLCEAPNWKNIWRGSAWSWRIER